jgi:hypothetical protein
MRTTTSNDITRTETLSDADLEQVAGGFCATPPEIGVPAFAPDTVPWPPPKWPTSPLKDAESMLPESLWVAK